MTQKEFFFQIGKLSIHFWKRDDLYNAYDTHTKNKKIKYAELITYRCKYAEKNNDW